MTDWDARYFGPAEVPRAKPPDRDAVEAAMVEYMHGVVARGEPWSHVSRHMLGLRNGLAGARHWRQVWSDHRLKHESPTLVSQRAREGAAAFA